MAAIGLYKMVPLMRDLALPSKYNRGMHRDGFTGHPFMWMMLFKVDWTAALFARG